MDAYCCYSCTAYALPCASITLFTLLLEHEALVHVAPALWPLPLLSSLNNKVDDSSEKLGSDILPSHVALYGL
jgi:hypothetical protein